MTKPFFGENFEDLKIRAAHPLIIPQNMSIMFNGRGCLATKCPIDTNVKCMSKQNLASVPSVFRPLFGFAPPASF